MRTILTLLGASQLALPAASADMPARKPGLWEITTRSTAGGQMNIDTEMMRRLQQQYGR
ncbi:MAG: hypothetical protein AB1591_08395 [Pseudomonadota bacterium]